MSDKLLIATRDDDGHAFTNPYLVIGGRTIFLSAHPNGWVLDDPDDLSFVAMTLGLTE